jgi:hypothetical protein
MRVEVFLLEMCIEERSSLSMCGVAAMPLRLLLILLLLLLLVLLLLLYFYIHRRRLPIRGASITLHGPPGNVVFVSSCVSRAMSFAERLYEAHFGYEQPTETESTPHVSTMMSRGEGAFRTVLQ